MTLSQRAVPRVACGLLGGAAILAGLFACTGSDSLVVVRPKIVVEPEAGSEILFEEVVLERTEAEPRIIRVGNEGEGALVFESIDIEGEHAAHFSISSIPRPLAPAQIGEVFVKFVPTIPGDLTAVLVIRSNDNSTPEVRFTLRGPAREACRIAVTPAHQTLLLGEIRQIAITAETTHECKIVRLFTDESVFKIVDAPELPFVVEAGTTQNIDVQHVRVPRTQGVPVREFRVKESEGQERLVTLQGEPPVTDCISVFPDQVLFPNTVVGETAVRSVVVRNRCSREASVTSVAVGEGAYYFKIDRSLYPVAIPGLGSIEIPVTYVPFASTGDAGWLYINTNDAIYPQVPVRLYGEASVPAIDAFPQTVDFGAVVFKNPQGVEQRSECASRSLFVHVFSNGDAPLTISDLEIDAAGDQLFLITGVTIAGQPVQDINQPMVVDPEQEMRVFIQFFPIREDPSEHRGRLLIHHNAAEMGVGLTEIRLRGTGKPDGAVVDMFQQLDGPKVDILWVIDDSCSMYDEQARLIQNLSQFVGYADSQSADYQMAVTDTDARSSKAGKFQRCFPHPAIIGSDYATSAIRQEAFECTFDVGTSGSGIEAGLGAAKKALERALDPDLEPNLNANFVRRDANLAIVIMSDEDDQSIESTPLLINYFNSVKDQQPDRVAVHAIAGPVDTVCVTGQRMAAPGFRYRRMTQDTGGIFFDICQPDWQPVLTQLGLDVFTPLDEWSLSQAADPNALIVTVDGVQVQRSSGDGYTYNPVGNSIKFHGTALPPPGAQIEASYTGLCRP